MLTPYLYDPKTGSYDINIAWNNSGTTEQTTGGNGIVYVPNASVIEPHWFYDSANNPPVSPNGTLDALWNLLPYSGPGGTRYRFALRVIDLSSRLNLNSGYPGNTANPYPGVSPDPYGQYLSSCPIWLSDVSGNPADNSNIQYLQTSTNPPGREGTSSMPYTLQTWQTQQLFNYELPVPPPTQFFGLTSELELLTYGSYGSSFGSTYTGGWPDGGLPYNCRPALILPNTLGATTNGMPDATDTGYRSFFTTYSWDRNYFPEPNTTTFPVPGGPLLAPATYPYILNLNQPAASATAIGTLAHNIALAMLDAGYKTQQADSFAVNYVTYRFDNQGVGTTPYNLPSGPAYVDDSGQLFVPWMSSSPAGSLPPPGSGLAIMGFAAQPFLNELAVAATYPKGGPVFFTNSAVELFNPFTVPLSLTGWQIKIYNETTGTYSSPPVTLTTSIPPDGYLVIAENGSTGFTPPPVGTVITNPNLVFPPAAPFQVVLFRPGGPGNNGFPVDTFDTVDPALPPPGGSVFSTITGPGTYSIQRANGAGTAIWGCAQAVQDVPTIPGDMLSGDTLGARNMPTTPSGQGIPLYDRFADGSPITGTPVPNDGIFDLINLADLNCIPRLANMETLPGGTPLSLSTLLELDVLSSQSFPPGSSVFNGEQYQFHVYFDFANDPRAAFTSTNTTTTTTSAVPPSFLSMISLNDRASTSTPGGLPNPFDAVRIPGKINVNTAGANVLATAFSNVPTGLPITPQQMAADVIAFRNRDPAGTIYIPTVSGTVTPITTPSYSTYQGYGLRSLGDMLVAFLPTEISSGNPPTTMRQCDAAWADVANFCTVRSDTFAVYGLIQALKLNGNYPKAYYHQTDWYNANQGNPIGSNPTENTIAADNPNAEFILLGQRRFIAIIDRSFSNTGTGPGGTTILEPKVVALKNLPQ